METHDDAEIVFQELQRHAERLQYSAKEVSINSRLRLYGSAVGIAAACVASRLNLNAQDMRACTIAILGVSVLWHGGIYYIDRGERAAMKRSQSKIDKIVFKNGNVLTREQFQKLHIDPQESMLRMMSRDIEQEKSPTKEKILRVAKILATEMHSIGSLIVSLFAR